MKGESPEAIDPILKRYNIDPSDYKTIREFQAAIRAAFSKAEGKSVSLNAGLMVAASEYFQRTQFSFPKYDIKRVTFYIYGIPQVRYVVPLHPGLWGYPKTAEYVREQMEA